MPEPSTPTVVALTNLVTKLVQRITDRKSAAELREVQMMVNTLASENFGLQQKNLQMQTELAELQQVIARFKQREADNDKKQMDTGENFKIHRGVKFRKNVATGQKWMPFCPNCDTILQVAEPPYSQHGLHCTKPKCGFRSSFPSSELEKVTAEIGD